MKELRISLIALVAGFAFACGEAPEPGTQIVAHRGYWEGNAQNSIASLAKAQEFGCWGSECDVHLTADGVVVVNHDRQVGTTDIQNCPLDSVRAHLLANGECIPTLDEYLDQALKDPGCVLVVEIKPHEGEEREKLVVQTCLESIRAKDMLHPGRVAFISFSYFICKELARECPGFTVQYLEGDKSPEEVFADGINGIDYHYFRFREHPEWVQQAHEKGMSVNVWTVDNEEDIREMLALGVDQITTNNPALVRELLAEVD